MGRQRFIRACSLLGTVGAVVASRAADRYSRSGRPRADFGCTFLPPPRLPSMSSHIPIAVREETGRGAIRRVVRAEARGAASVAFAAFAAIALAVSPAAAGQAAAVGSGLDLSGVWAKAASSAFKGGISGFIAGVAQVLTFMWLRTSMNYQYFNGGNLPSALKTLWSEGGLGRLYQGISFALVQAPLSRFGDTAANAGVLVLTEYFLPDLPLAAKTAAGSTAAALWRVFLTPIDTMKTIRQVQGEGAMDVLMGRVREKGIGELYAGAIANFVANWVGNYPYFFVFNTLSESWAVPEDAAARIVRNGILGMCSSTASDLVSNSFRVVKTMRQSSADASLNYIDAARGVIERDGVVGLLGRGLETRLLVNVLQGTFFTIVWKLVEESLK